MVHKFFETKSAMLACKSAVATDRGTAINSN